MRFSSLALLLFGLSVLLPQGVGIRLPAGLPNLDLPRMAMLALLGLLVLRTLTEGRVTINGAPRTLLLLAAITGWQFLSAIASESPRASLVWAGGNTITYWGFAFAVLCLAGEGSRRERVVRVLTVIGVLLAIWSVFELVTQAKVFPVRNVWADPEAQRFSITLRRVIPGVELNLPLVSIGPYASNLPLAGALCALGGFLLVQGRKSRRAYRLSTALFLLAVLAAQSRAGIAAAIVMLVVNAVWRRGGGRPFPFLVALGIVTVGWLTVSELWKQSLSEVLKVSFATDSAGSVAGRLMGLRVLLEQVGRWWLLGFGPGSLFDADRVVTSVQIYSDPGSFVAFFVESGLPAGVLLTWLLGASLLDGGRHRDPDLRAATVGLIGFAVTALISLPPWVWGVALVQAGFIESWSRAERATVAASAMHPAPSPRSLPAEPAL